MNIVNYEQSRYITKYRVSPGRCKANLADWLVRDQGWFEQAAREAVQTFHDLRGDEAIMALWAGVMAEQVTAADVLSDLARGRASREVALRCEERWEQPIDTHFIEIDFGRHKGEPFTRVPVGYLRWMVNSGNHQEAEARAEIKRRGYEVMPEYDLEVSGHALDRASQPPILERWEADRFSDEESGWYEGLHHWLMRRSWEALERMEELQRLNGGNNEERTSVACAGLIFSFSGDVKYWPTLKTVSPEGGNDEWTGKPQLAAAVVS